jgi:hypothetical protein
VKVEVGWLIKGSSTPLATHKLISNQMEAYDGGLDDPDLSDLPFDVLQTLQQKVGLKKFKEYLRASEGRGSGG